MGPRLRAAFAVFAVAGGSGALALSGTAIGADRASAVEARAERPAALRFANLTDDGGSIDLLLDGRLRVVAMVGGRTTDFMVVASGRHTIGVRGDASPDAAAAELTVAPGTSATVLLLGRSSHPSVFTLPDVADSAPSIRVVNTSATRVHIGIADDGFDVDAGSSHLAPVHAGSVVVEAAVGGVGDASSTLQTATVRHTFTVRPTASMIAVVTGNPALLVIHGITPRASAPDALALQVDDKPPAGMVRSMFRHDGMWPRRILAGVVIVLVFAATLSSLAVFRVESLEDRVRNRMR